MASDSFLLREQETTKGAFTRRSHLRHWRFPGLPTRQVVPQSGREAPASERSSASTTRSAEAGRRERPMIRTPPSDRRGSCFFGAHLRRPTRAAIRRYARGTVVRRVHRGFQHAQTACPTSCREAPPASLENMVRAHRTLGRPLCGYHRWLLAGKCGRRLGYARCRSGTSPRTRWDTATADRQSGILRTRDQVAPFNDGTVRCNPARRATSFGLDAALDRQRLQAGIGHTRSKALPANVVPMRRRKQLEAAGALRA